MKPEDGGWFGDRWELTAPESYALLYGPKGEGKQIFKLALLELVARKRLTLVNAEVRHRYGKPGYSRTRSTARLKPGPEKEHPRSRSLGAMLDLLDGLPIGTKMRAGENGLSPATRGISPLPRERRSIPVTELAREARIRYGSFDNYTEIEVMPDLASRGLYQQRQRRFLGILPYKCWEITHAGEAARARFESRLSLGRKQFRRWVGSDPARALAAFLGSAGPSALLIEELHPDLQRLREHAGGEEHRRIAVAELVADVVCDYLSTLDVDQGAFEGLGGAFSAIDSGGSSSGGGGADGSGWFGSGDGGGGGGWSGGDGGGCGGDGGGGSC